MKSQNIKLSETQIFGDTSPVLLGIGDWYAYAEGRRSDEKLGHKITTYSQILEATIEVKVKKCSLLKTATVGVTRIGFTGFSANFYNKKTQSGSWTLAITASADEVDEVIE